ncbi:MAG: phosphate ABC transporter permease subunit PstC [Bacteroidales bacterium]|nr:phosphate ABC transporter permease subunit PstC [Bacteroidales bacterium]
MNFSFYRSLRNKISSGWMLACLLLVMTMPLLIGIGLFLKSTLLLDNNSIINLLFSKTWKPLNQNFGFYPFIISSIWVTLTAIIIAAPICLLTAIYLTQYSKKYFLKIMHPVIDILAGIPSVVYGVCGVLIIVPFVSTIAPIFGKQSSGYTILSGGIVLSIMITPFILNILIEIFRNIPDELKEASLSLGATKWETIKFVLIKKASPGIISSIGLGISRAFGETMAVLMVVGNVTKIPKNALDPGYPLPALIANNYGEMLSIPMYDSALMFGALILFVVVLFFNIISRLTITKLEIY